MYLKKLKSDSCKELLFIKMCREIKIISTITLTLHVVIRCFIFCIVLVLTEVHVLANHLARSQLVSRPKQCVSVSGLSLGLQNNSLPSAHATRLIFTPSPHSAEHCDSDK